MDGLIYSDGEKETLSRHDADLCVRAQSRLTQLTLRVFLRALFPIVSVKCVRPSDDDACKKAAVRISNLLPMKTASMSEPNPTIQCHKLFLQDFGDLCINCQGVIHAREQALGKQGWKEFPSLFNIDIPTWGDESS